MALWKVKFRHTLQSEDDPSPELEVELELEAEDEFEALMEANEWLRMLYASSAELKK